MDNKLKLATGASLLAIVAAALGYSAYEHSKHSQNGVSLPPSTVQSNQPALNSSPQGTEVRSTQEYSKSVQTGVTGAPVVEERSTTTSVKTSSVPPSTAMHQAYVSRRVRNEKPGNVHVVRALKHTTGFTANLPKRLRF
jgi:hypothetical protein